MTKTSALLALLLCLSIVSYTQTISPVNKAEFELTLDGAGKLTTISSFGIKKRDRFNVVLTHQAPVKAHQKFLKDLGETFEKAYERLTDDENKLLPLYAELWGSDFTTIKEDLKELGALLQDKDAEQKLRMADAGRFKFLGGQPFLVEQLFDKAFVLKLNDSSATGPVSSPLKIKMPVTAQEAGELELSVIRADFAKSFIAALYNKTRTENNTLFRGIRAVKFYRDSIAKRTELITEIERFKAGLDSTDLYLCQWKWDQFVELREKLEQNIFIRLLRSDWAKTWVWLNEGSLVINPLPFTDESLLVLKDGHDKTKAAAYDAYRASALKAMQNDSTLSEAKLQTAVYDALLQQAGTGAKVFSYAGENEKLKKENKSKAEEAQQVFGTVNKITIEVLEGEKPLVYRTYNAAQKLKGSSVNDMPTVSTDVKVKAVVFNIKTGEDFQLKENATAIPDQSKAVTTVAEVTDMLSVLSGQVVPVAGSVVSLLSKMRDPADKPKNFTIAPPGQMLSGNLKEMMEEEGFAPPPKNKKRLKYFYIRSSPQDKSILIDSLSGEELLSVRDFVVLFLVPKKLICPEFQEFVGADVAARMTPVRENVREDSAAYFLLRQMQSLEGLVEKAVERAYIHFSDRETTVVLNRLDQYLAMLHLHETSASYTLPPPAYKAETDTTPQLRNRIDSFAKETVAKEKASEILLMNNKGETITKVKDSYRTAPTHWIAPSIGISYMLHPFRRSNATIKDGEVVTTVDEDQLRLMAGVHVYLKEMIKADDRNFFKLNGAEKLSRISLFGGVSFPQPLYNLHLGGAVDIWAGVKLTGGVHFYRYTVYTVLNNTISDQKSNYEYNGAFVALQFDPVAVIKLLGLIK